MEKKSELSKRESSENLTINEQKFYEDVRFILQQAREKAYICDFHSCNCKSFPIGQF